MAGLSVMSGKNLGDALSEAAQLKQKGDYQAMQMQLWQAQAAQAIAEAGRPNAPNVQFNPTTGELMVTQYNPSTGQLSIGGAPQEYGQQQGGGMQQQPVMPNMPQGQPSMPPTVAGMSPRARGDYESEAAKGMAKQSGEDVKKGKQADNLLSMLDTAEQIIPQATGGGAEAYGAGAKGFFGKSDAKTQSDSRLETIAGWMVSNVPRMEGPQSNFDVENYKTMAARVGNKEIPKADRLAAVGELRKLQQKYSHLNGGQQMQPKTTQQNPQGQSTPTVSYMEYFK